jgi:hypothetical protein
VNQLAPTHNQMATDRLVSPSKQMITKSVTRQEEQESASINS